MQAICRQGVAKLVSPSGWLWPVLSTEKAGTKGEDNRIDGV